MSHTNESPKVEFVRTPILLYLLNALALLGVGLSTFLTQHFYQVREGTAGFKSFCNLGGKVNCDLIAASPYAELFAGLPLSSFGGGWFIALFFTSLIAHNRYWRREALRLCVGLTGVGLLFELFYLFVMIFKLKAYCMLCLGVDAVGILALLTTLGLRPEGFSLHRPNLSQWKVLATVFVGSLILGVIGFKAFETGSLPHSVVDELAKSVLESPVLSVKSNDDFPTIGPKNAPITLVEFSDFQCPFCRMAAFSIQSVMNRYPNQIRVVFRNFPLDQACNREVQHSAHPFACEAARVALCAHKNKKFEPIYEELFQQQASFAPGRPAEIAKSLGMDINQIQSCAASSEISSAVSQDIEEAITLGVKSTPTFFINGHKAEGALPPQVWNKIIDQLLGR